MPRIDNEFNTGFKELKELKKKPPKVAMKPIWSKINNIATIKMRDLTRRLRDAGEWKTNGLGSGDITIEAVEKDKKLIAVVKKLNGDFVVKAEDKADSVFRIIAESPEIPPVVLEIKRNIGDKTHILYMALSFVGLSFAAVGLCAWLAF